MVTPAVKREAVAHLKARLGLSERRACRIAGADRTMIRYQAQRAPDTALPGRLRELANERRRGGYRRLFVLLRREGSLPGSIGSVGSTARMEDDQETVRGTVSPTTLTVRKRKARRKAIGTRAPILVEARSSQCTLVPWISSTTSSPTASAFGCSTWSTTSPGNASRRSRTPRSRGTAWRVN